MDVRALQGALHQHSGCLGSEQALGALGAVPAFPPLLPCPRGLPLGVGDWTKRQAGCLHQPPVKEQSSCLLSFSR